MVHVAQGGDIQHDGLADGGGEEDQDDAPKGHLLTLGPHEALAAHGTDDVVEKAVVLIEHPLPDHDYRHRARDHRQVEYAPEEGTGSGVHLVNGGAHPQGKGGDRGNGHHHNDHRIDGRLPEDGVIEKADVVIEENEIGTGVGVGKAGVGKAGDHAHGHGREDESNEEKQRRQQKQIRYDGLSALED